VQVTQTTIKSTPIAVVAVASNPIEVHAFCQVSSVLKPNLDNGNDQRRQFPKAYSMEKSVLPPVKLLLHHQHQQQNHKMKAAAHQ
jgi:hypothetical protein